MGFSLEESLDWHNSLPPAACRRQNVEVCARVQRLASAAKSQLVAEKLSTTARNASLGAQLSLQQSVDGLQEFG